MFSGKRVWWDQIRITSQSPKNLFCSVGGSLQAHFLHLTGRNQTFCTYCVNIPRLVLKMTLPVFLTYCWIQSFFKLIWFIFQSKWLISSEWEWKWTELSSSTIFGNVLLKVTELSLIKFNPLRTCYCFRFLVSHGAACPKQGEYQIFLFESLKITEYMVAW